MILVRILGFGNNDKSGVVLLDIVDVFVKDFQTV